jgi:hypothetical protein
MNETSSLLVGAGLLVMILIGTAPSWRRSSALGGLSAPGL